MSESVKPLLTAEEVGMKLGVSADSVLRWATAGKIKNSVFVGKRRLFPGDIKKPGRKKYISSKRGIAA